MGRGRVYSREFKWSVVRQVVSGEKRPAQVCREHGLGESLLLRWRREYETCGEAAFVPHQPSETEALQRRFAEAFRLGGQLALENAILKGRCAAPLAERHAMIAQAQHGHPPLSARRLWTLLGVARRWYSERPTIPSRNERDVALRDAIEQIVLEFPGYGYRRVTKALMREGWVVNHKRVLRVMR